jgi:hypothetical protein
MTKQLVVASLIMELGGFGVESERRETMGSELVSEAAAANFQVQAFFYHDRLLQQFLPKEQVGQISDALSTAEPGPRLTNMSSNIHEDLIGSILAHRPRELSEWLLEDRSVGSRQLVTTTQAFYFRKLSEGTRGFRATSATDADTLLEGRLSEYRCVGETGLDLLSGQRRFSMLAYAEVRTQLPNREIELTPLFIGKVTERWPGEAKSNFIIETRREVYASEVDEFSKIQDVKKPSKIALNLLSKLPEENVKDIFAEILGQPFVPKDWGGETSDLGGTVTFAGKQMSAAFAFKGPAVQGKFSIAKMGKNADQGLRLFHESIDIAVVQYHGGIEAAVKNLMEALARSRGRRFMLLDGATTARIFEAYGYFDGSAINSP